MTPAPETTALETTAPETTAPETTGTETTADTGTARDTTGTALRALWAPLSRVGLGEGYAAELVAEHTSRETVAVVLDAGLPAEVIDHLRPAPRAGAGRTVEWALAADTIDLTTLTATAADITARLGRVDTVLAIGGGSVLDAAAVLRIMLADGRRPSVARSVARSLAVGRSGLVTMAVDEGDGPGPRLVSVPTTIGTAAEVSRAATVAHDGRRRLVNGDRLAADEVALDPVMTRTLPAELLRSGLAEAMLRAVNVFVAQPGPGWCPAADEEVLGLLTALARRGHAAAAGDHGDELRLDAAFLSCRTVLGPWAVGGHPFVGRTWFCANELASAAGVSKMAATLAVAPPVWARLAGGDRRFGHPERLAVAWSAVRRAEPALAAPPADGLRDLVTRWHLPRMAWPDDLRGPELARRTVRHWGGGLPMLAGLDLADLLAVFGDARAECA